MPIQVRVAGNHIVHEVVPWPAECRLKSKPVAQLSEAEITRELKLLDDGNEDELHRAFCVNADCPAKR